MKYIIDWCEVRTTTTGKKKLDATLKDENGVVTDKVTIWDSWKGFDDLRAGSTVLGKITEKQNGQYLNKTLTADVTYSAGRPAFNKAPQIAEAMQRKEESIKGFQENKQDSMKVFAAYRDATLMVTRFLPEGTPEAIVKQEHKHWVQYFMGEINNTLGQPF